MSERILFVDDEATPNADEFVPVSYLSYYETNLHSSGFTVEIANNANDAFEMLKAHKANPYRCLIVDVHMPIGKEVIDKTEYGGVWLSQQLQREYPDVFVIILTNVTDPEVIQQLEKLDVVKVILFKHVCLPSTLVKVVKKVSR